MEFDVMLFFRIKYSCVLGFPGGSEVKASACNVGDLGSIPGSGRFPGEGNGNPLEYSCLENPRDGGACWVAVYGVAQSRTWLTRLSSRSSTPPFLNLFHLPPHQISLGCSRALALGTLLCALNLHWSFYFTYGNLHVSVLFSQTIPPSPSPTESKSLFCTSMSPFVALHAGSLVPSF